MLGDTATLAVRALGVPPAACAQMLVAEWLRPWPIASAQPWTVRITLSAAGASAHRLDSEGARNAIDAGDALMATEDLELVAYAGARPGMVVTPLPWDRTYLLLSAAPAATLGAGTGPDAVRVDARAAESWGCESVLSAASPDTASGRSGRVLYDIGDRTARELAARIVALTDQREGTAVGMSATELDRALTAGDALAYIISVARASRCDAMTAIAGRAPWVGLQAVHPLIDTRAYGIAPRVPRP